MTLKLKFATFAVDAKADTTGKPDGFVAGWASVDTIDSGYDKFAPDAFAESLTERGLQGPQGVKFLLDHSHDTQSVAGAITVLEYRDNPATGTKGLYIEAQLDLKNERVANAYRAATLTGGLSFSVGFKTVDYAIDDSGVRHIIKADLREVSVVIFSMNKDAIMTGVKSEGGDDEIVPLDSTKCATMSEFEKMLQLSIVEGVQPLSRKAAHALVLVIKANKHLFAPTGEVPVAKPTTETEDKSSPQLETFKSGLDDLIGLLRTH